MKRPIMFLVAIVVVLAPLTSCSLLKIRSGGDLNILSLEYAEAGGTDFTDGPTDEAVALKMTISDTQSANSDLDVTDADFDTSNRTGFYIGLALSDVAITDNLTLQPEINYIGVKDFDQLQVPALLNYRITDQLYAHAGPSLSYLLNAPVHVKTTNFAMDFGASYTISEKFALEARYDLGLTNLLENATSGNRLKMSNLQIGLTYRLGASN